MFRDLEARLTGRALAWVGGVALVLGMIFFTSLAFSRGWIGPELRVLIGIVAGTVALAAGAILMEQRNRLLGQALTPVGLAVITISLIGATRLYDLVPVSVGLAVAMTSAAIAAVVAVRADAPIVAGFGLIGVLIAPPLLDAPADTATLAYVGIALLATTAIALWRSWRWLPMVAFLLAAPQVAVWIAEESAPDLALAGLATFWLLNVVAAGGETLRRGRDDLSSSSASLLVANVTFLVAAGFRVLDDDLTSVRGPFLVAIALAHFVIGGFFVLRHGERHLFGLLALGTGVAALSMAAPIHLGASAVPVAWTGEAAALAMVAVWRRHPYSAIGSGILYLIAGAYLIAVFAGVDPVPSYFPEVGGHSVALTFFLAGIAAGVLIVRDLGLRSTLLAFGLLVGTACAWLGLSPTAGVVGMTVLAVAGAIGWRSLPGMADHRVEWQTHGLLLPNLGTAAEWRPTLVGTLPGALLAMGLTTLLRLIVAFYGSSAILGEIPFVDPPGAALMFALLGLAAVAMLSPDIRVRDPLLAAGLVVTALVLPAELDGPALAVALSSLALIGLVATMVSGVQVIAYLLPSLALVVFGATFTFLEVAPPSLLVVGDTPIEPVAAIRHLAAIASVGVYLVAFAWTRRPTPWARPAWLLAGMTLAYLLSVAVVDVIGMRSGGTLSVDEARTQGHVALSVLWALMGVIGFVAGLRSRVAVLRQAGLALLTIATAKVFLFDLAALDVAYRVISLIVVGLLLLVSAWLWQRVQVGSDADSDDPPDGDPPDVETSNEPLGDVPD